MAREASAVAWEVWGDGRYVDTEMFRRPYTEDEARRALRRKYGAIPTGTVLRPVAPKATGVPMARKTNPVVAAPRSVNPLTPKESRAAIRMANRVHGRPGVATPENFVRATRGKAGQAHSILGVQPRRGNPKRRNPAAATVCRHTLPLQEGDHAKVEICYPQGVFSSLKAAVVNIQRELCAKYGRLKAAPALRRAVWAFSDAAQTRGRWTFTG